MTGFIPLHEFMRSPIIHIEGQGGGVDFASKEKEMQQPDYLNEAPMHLRQSALKSRGFIASKPSRRN